MNGVLRDDIRTDNTGSGQDHAAGDDSRGGIGITRNILDDVSGGHKVGQAILNGIHGIGSNQSIGDSACSGPADLVISQGGGRCAGGVE